jgi:PAS domain S-box-containing protein
MSLTSDPPHHFTAGLFPGQGAAASRMRAIDWSATPLGPVSGWPSSLKTIVHMMLRSRFAMWMCWGPDLTFFCNDAYAPTLGLKQGWAIGARSDKVWEEIWPDIGPRIAGVFEKSEATWDEDLMLFLERSGYSEETYHTFSYSPLSDDDGSIRGMLCVVTEVTERVLAERRVATLRELGAQTGRARSVEEVCQIAMDVIAGNPRDFPYAVIRLFDPERREARFVASTGLTLQEPVIPYLMRVEEEPRLILALERDDVVAVDLSPDETAVMPKGAWPRPPTTAFVAPMLAKSEAGMSGFLGGGLNPHRAFDGAYQGFVRLVAAQIASAIANANAHEEDRARVQALAELDYAKTAFFSNVSHEFRTPLTLMLGPLEEAMGTAQDSRLDMVHRNALRLLRLVNTLLDFARAEAGRATTQFTPVDLGDLTRDLVSNFRSAFGKAGLTLDVDIGDLGGPVGVDPGMWEKIVLNLLSNAFKFTLEGGVRVALAIHGDEIELSVADTGVGIPEEHLPRVFDRFHRIENQKGRTHEGTGIGLALVSDLAALHDGRAEASSTVGTGSTFRVHIPVRRMSEAAGGPERPLASRASYAFVAEALRWLPEHLEEEGACLPTARPCIVLADDNADMRSYVARILDEAGYDVVVTGDGEAALQAIRRVLPALVLSDVMMPRLDGFELIAALRADPATASLPVILLSARTGEEAQIEGLGSGADDYITKPFASRELVARIQATISHSQQRADMLQQAESSARSLRLVADALPALVSYIDREERYRFSNQAYIDWFGRDATGQSMREVLGDAAYEMVRPYIDRALSGERLTYEANIPYRDGGDRNVEATYVPDLDAHGQTRGFYVLVYDMTERLRKDAALAESERRFREMADNSPVMVWVTEAGGDCSYLSRRWYAFTGQTETQGLGFGWLEATHPEDRARSEHVFRDANADQVPFILEYRLRRWDGEYRWCLDAASPRLGKEGEFLGYVGSVIDITERKQAEDRQLLMINELNHRVKNSLAVVQSLALQGLRASSDNPALFRDMFLGRLSALAQAHDLLTRSDWTGAQMEDIVANALSGFAGADRFAAKGPRIRLPARAAVPLSMAFHELATNAAKYGALSNETGRVTIDWRVEDAADGPELSLAWTERGGPLVAPPAHRGFGSRLIEQGLRHELDSDISMYFPPEGLRCHMRIPLERTPP